MGEYKSGDWLWDSHKYSIRQEELSITAANWDWCCWVLSTSWAFSCDCILHAVWYFRQRWKVRRTNYMYVVLLELQDRNEFPDVPGPSFVNSYVYHYYAVSQCSATVQWPGTQILVVPKFSIPCSSLASGSHFKVGFIGLSCTGSTSSLGLLLVSGESFCCIST